MGIYIDYSSKVVFEFSIIFYGRAGVFLFFFLFFRVYQKDSFDCAYRVIN